MKKLLAVTLLSAAPALGFDHNHTLWDKALKTYSSQGLVKYAALQKNDQDLKNYLDSLASVSKTQYDSFTKDQQLAFWINAYNAFTVKAILDHYPIQRKATYLKGLAYPESSIRQIPGVWDKLTWNAAGQKIVLQDIENKILRQELKEPRIHFAINCASLGCPALRSEAYRAGSIEKQLDQAASEFINNPQKNRFDVAAGTLYLSQIFKWFGEDFGDLPAYLSHHAVQDKPVFLPGKKWKIQWLPYDWSLNELK